MLVQTLIAAGKARRQSECDALDGPALALAALNRIQEIFPNAAGKNRSPLAFAREILSINPSAGSQDDWALLRLMWIGGEVSERMNALIARLDSLTNAEKAKLDALQGRYMSDLADFFAEVGSPALSDIFARGRAGRSSTTDTRQLDDLTVIRGIGRATAMRMEGMGVATLSDLAGMTDEMVDRVASDPKMPPNADVSGWRQQARDLLGQA